jgi:hypothetical protein
VDKDGLCRAEILTPEKIDLGLDLDLDDWRERLSSG